MANGETPQKETNILSVEMPTSNFGCLEKPFNDSPNSSQEPLEGDPKELLHATTKANDMQPANTNSLEQESDQKLTDNSQTTKETLPLVEPRLTSDELLSLAEIQLLELKMNPFPVELWIPDDIGSLHIPGTPESNTNNSLGWKVRSLCDTLEFKINTAGRFIAELFVDLPLKEEYPDYYNIIERPICINNIRKKHYEDIHEVVGDFALMFKNARTYNTKGSMVYQDSLELQMEFARELQKNFPEEAKELELLLTTSGDTKKERLSRKSTSTPLQPIEQQQELETVVEDESKTRVMRNPRLKHGSWLKRKREDNFFVYGSGSDTDVISDAEKERGTRRKKKDARKSYEANSRKGKIGGGR